MTSPIGKAYKPWLIVCVVVLVCSLFLLAVVATIAFVYFADKQTPLWVIVLGGVAALGVGLGFAGFFGLMVVAGWHGFREGRKVQVISPPHDQTKP